MGDSAGEASRRRVFTPHAHDLAKMRRCPICRWAVEQDHVEALRIQPNRTPLAPTPPVRPPAARAGVQDEEAVVSFALV
jgi:hypothetical protein